MERSNHSTIANETVMDGKEGILEVAILEVKKGLESDFESSILNAQSIIKRAKGYISHSIEKCIETPGRYILLVRWETQKDHEEGFRNSADYKEWKSLLHHFYEPFPLVEHYKCLS